MRADGSVASTDAEKAQTLADFFSSVFCKEDGSSDIPGLNSKYEGPVLEDMEISAAMVES